MWVGSVTDQQFHYFVGYLMIYQNRGEIKGRLSGLRLQSIDNNRIIFLQQSFDLIDGTKNQNRLTNTLWR